MPVTINGTSGITTPGLDASGTNKFATTIGVGGATPSASGAGITFPATVSLSSDVNTLDDYEEGSWTPITSANVSVTYAYYTKIGRVVTIYGAILHTGTITSYDTIQLPFQPITSGSANFRYTGGVAFFESGTGTSAINIRLFYQGNQGTACFFWGQSGGESWPYSMVFSGGNGIPEYGFQMTYVTAS
jgi:hypothetical protein